MRSSAHVLAATLVFASIIITGCTAPRQAQPQPVAEAPQRPALDSAPLTPALTARLEADAHEHCFTVRFFLKNTGESDIEVIYGAGEGGMRVVPHFELAGYNITPPTYLQPPRRSMRPDIKIVPAGQEILYGTFTMGYPPDVRGNSGGNGGGNGGGDRGNGGSGGGEAQLSGTIHFRELKVSLRTEPQVLRLPAARPHKQTP